MAGSPSATISSGTPRRDAALANASAPSPAPPNASSAKRRPKRSSVDFAGAIQAALYLQEFVSSGTRWAHVDTYAWNQKSRPGRPEGGEALGLRAAYAMIAERFDG